MAHGCRETKKLICGMEGKNVAAFGRLPSPALPDGALYLFFRKMRKKNKSRIVDLKPAIKEPNNLII